MSSVHVERYEQEARIRFRWEDQLLEKYVVDLGQYNALISRIKILAELDISERRLPQDGRIHLQQGQDQDIDIRVSTIPAKFGEKVVMRLLTRSKAHLDLDRLGMQPQEQKHYQEAIRQPNGIVLITGPTGSGKTTTLYATLQQLNQPDKNLLTIEDPIEYNLTGINQVQLKEEIGLSFDKALRAFLRQDPDIIMVGEIRDEPTARIAIRAALTGHLVFSTLHTNSAWDAITRLVDMGIEPYLLVSGLRLVVAQRLVRVLCEHCKQPITDHSFAPQGCPRCYYTGYKGRRAVYEMLPFTRKLAQLIQHDQGESALEAYREEVGLPTLAQNLDQLVKEGVTSKQERALWG